MIRSATCVFKNHQVKRAGRKRLSNTPMAPNRDVPQAKAQILSQEDGCVVIQVLCGCGQEIQLRCAYDEKNVSIPAEKSA